MSQVFAGLGRGGALGPLEEEAFEGGDRDFDGHLGARGVERLKCIEEDLCFGEGGGSAEHWLGESLCDRLTLVGFATRTEPVGERRFGKGSARCLAEVLLLLLENSLLHFRRFGNDPSRAVGFIDVDFGDASTKDWFQDFAKHGETALDGFGLLDSKDDLGDLLVAGECFGCSTLFEEVGSMLVGFLSDGSDLVLSAAELGANINVAAGDRWIVVPVDVEKERSEFATEVVGARERG